MKNDSFENHRCDGLLESECAIRKYPKSSIAHSYKDGEWHLFNRVYNFDRDWVVMNEVSKVLYCPWCGEKLP